MFGRVCVVIVALAGCYRPTFVACEVQCEASGHCPGGTSCAVDGYCHAGGDTSDCRDSIVACGQDVCTARGKNCGEVLDSCGMMIECGSCTLPEMCGGGGPNVCGDGPCTPRSCSDAHALCGHPSDNCSGVLDCGGCTAPASCGGGGADLTCGCGTIPTSAAAAHRMGHSQVFTGSSMIVWGGRLGSNYYNEGAIYSFATRTWTALPTAHAPSPRAGHTAVWTGTQMIVWGGQFGDSYYRDGAIFTLATNTWSALPTSATTPGERAYHTAVWAGTQMIVWGGQFGQQDPKRDGATYDPVTKVWAALPIDAHTPDERAGHSAVWTGNEMIVWGGIIGSIPGLLECGGSSIYNDGGRYNPATHTWTTLAASAGTPDFRTGHSAVWTGSQMVVWGGCNGSNYYDDGKAYSPATGAWTAIAGSAACTPGARAFHRAVWTGDDVLVWGGVLGSDYYDDGYRFAP